MQETPSHNRKLLFVASVLLVLIVVFLVIAGSVPLLSNTFISLFPKPTSQALEHHLAESDINQDGVINVFDLGLLIGNYQKTIPANPDALLLRCDVNRDNVINIFDLGILAGNYGKTTMAPTPTQSTITPTPTQAPDLSRLVPKTLVVPSQFRSGVFAEGRTLNLPEVFEIGVYAAGLSGPRHIEFDNQGNLYIAEKNANRVVVVRDQNGDRVGDDPIPVITELRVVNSIDLFEGDLYIAEEHQISVLRGIKPEGTYTSRVVLVANLPTGGGHTTRTVVIGPDRKMYVSIGSSCNVCEEDDPRRASVVRYNLDGSGEEVYADGLRNSVGLVFNQNVLWSVDNGRDQIGNDIPPEEVNVLNVGKHYGWPYCYGRGITNPEFPGRSSFCLNETEFPRYEMQAHSAPLGLVFAPTNSPFATSNLFIGFHGSWNRTPKTGYKVVRIDTSLNNAQTVDFVTGWLVDNSSWGRPVDVRFNNVGDLYISDDGAGAIYRVYRR